MTGHLGGARGIAPLPPPGIAAQRELKCREAAIEADDRGKEAGGRGGWQSAAADKMPDIPGESSVRCSLTKTCSMPKMASEEESCLPTFCINFTQRSPVVREPRWKGRWEGLPQADFILV